MHTKLKCNMISKMQGSRDKGFGNDNQIILMTPFIVVGLAVFIRYIYTTVIYRYILTGEYNSRV